MSKPQFIPPVNTWTWRALGQPPPARKPLSPRVKATIQAPLMAAVGWLIFHFFGHVVVPLMVWTLAGLVLIGGWLVPPVFHAIERFGQAIARFATIGLNWLLLVPFFYLCFLPGRIILMLRRIDPMDRVFPDPRPSFWIPRKPVDTAQYKRQH